MSFLFNILSAFSINIIYFDKVEFNHKLISHKRCIKEFYFIKERPYIEELCYTKERGYIYLKKKFRQYLE